MWAFLAVTTLVNFLPLSLSAAACAISPKAIQTFGVGGKFANFEPSVRPPRSRWKRPRSIATPADRPTPAAAASGVVATARSIHSTTDGAIERESKLGWNGTLHGHAATLPS